VQGTSGPDRIQTVNGVRDVVSCGRGRDLATIDLFDRITGGCEVVTREISRDPYRGRESQHETEVEPDTAAHGSTVVAVFQSGRISDGGAANIGFAVSRDRGRTWRHGFLPGLTPLSRPRGSFPRATDPSIAYDAVHRIWLAASLLFGPDSSGIVVSRSSDGAHWTRPVSAILVPPPGGFLLDKEWIACDNGRASPFRGRCYVSYDDLGSSQIATEFSTDAGRTWSAPASGPGFPGRSSIQGAFAPGVQPVVRPDGTVLIPFFDETRLALIRSTDGGATWSAPLPIAPASYRGHRGLRAAPLPSAEVDGAGRVYVTWPDCSRRRGCAANDILVSRSADGVSWSAPVRVPTGAADTELPGLAADPAASGRLALAYYVLRRRTLEVFFVASADGGVRWTKPQRLSSRSFSLGWIARTSQGAMIGDYISTSFAGGRAVPVFALATRPRGGLRESIFSTSLAVSKRR
jgi:BNR repeat-like domain